MLCMLIYIENNVKFEEIFSLHEFYHQNLRPEHA